MYFVVTVLKNCRQALSRLDVSWMQRCLTPAFLLSVCKYTCRLATLGWAFWFSLFSFFFLKAAWADLTQQQRSWEIWASVRFVSQLRWKFFGCWIFLFFSVFNHFCLCVPALRIQTEIFITTMFASIWYAKKLGRRFVHNARKAKAEKVCS